MDGFTLELAERLVCLTQMLNGAPSIILVRTGLLTKRCAWTPREQDLAALVYTLSILSPMSLFYSILI